MRHKTLLVMALLISAVSLGHAQNLLQNPGFETVGGGGTWATNPAVWWNYGAGCQQDWAAQPQVGGVLGCWFGGWNTGGDAGIGQNVDVNLTNGNVFKFTINLLCESDFTSTNSELFMKMEFSTNGVIVESVTNDIYALAKEPLGTEWNTYTLIHTNTHVGVDRVNPMLIGGQFLNVGGAGRSMELRQANL